MSGHRFISEENSWSMRLIRFLSSDLNCHLQEVKIGCSGIMLGSKNREA